MKLYEIVAEIENCVDYETGEIDVERLDALNIEKQEKIHNIGLWIKDLKAEAKALKEEKDVFTKRQKAVENKAQSLTRYLESCLNGETFKDTDLVISYRKSTSVDLAEDFESNDERFVTYDVKYNKSEIKKIIQSGEQVKGAQLVEKQNMQIK